MNALKVYESESSSEEETDHSPSWDQTGPIDYFSLKRNLSDTQDSGPTEPKNKIIKSGDTNESVELPNTEFWQNVENQNIVVHSLLQKQNNDKNNIAEHNNKIDTESHYNKDKVKNFTEGCEKFNFSTVQNHLKKSTRPKTEIKHSHQTQSDTVQERKLYYLHSKITHCLYKKSKNSAPVKLEKEIFAHKGVINCVKWNIPNYSHLFLTASMDTKIKIWNIWSQLDPCLKVVNVHSKAVKDAEWSICGKKILSCSYDRQATVTDVESGINLLDPSLCKSLQIFRGAHVITQTYLHEVDKQVSYTSYELASQYDFNKIMHNVFLCSWG